MKHFSSRPSKMKTFAHLVMLRPQKQAFDPFWGTEELQKEKEKKTTVMWQFHQRWSNINAKPVQTLWRNKKDGDIYSSSVISTIACTFILSGMSYFHLIMVQIVSLRCIVFQQQLGFFFFTVNVWVGLHFCCLKMAVYRQGQIKGKKHMSRRIKRK